MISLKLPSCCLPKVNVFLIHSFFNKEKTRAETETRIYLISSIWGDNHIMSLNENNWKFLWYNKVFQGINATKALAPVMGNEGVHIKSCYVPKDKAHKRRYQELHNFKQDRKCVLLDYSEKMKAYISSLQNKSYAAIKSTIHISSKSITSSNDTNSSEMSGFSYASNITTKSNSRSLQMVHLFLILMAILKN